MKLVEFFKKLKENGKISHADYDKFLESVPELDFPDTAYGEFENKFLTIDRAKAHPEVNNKLRAELLDPVDRDFEKLLDFDLKDYIEQGRASELKGEKSTYKKIAALGPLMLDAIKKVKAKPETDEDTKKKLQLLEDTKNDLLKKIESANSEFSTKEKELKSNYEKQLKDYRLNGELEKLANSYTLADAFEPKRSAITKVTLAELRSLHNFDLGENNGQAEVQVMDKDGKPLFNGNTQVTAKSLLDDAFKAYVKQSDSPNPQKPHQETRKFQTEGGSPNQGRKGVRNVVE
jgi:hypothetical protein